MPTLRDTMFGEGSGRSLRGDPASTPGLGDESGCAMFGLYPELLAEVHLVGADSPLAHVEGVFYLPDALSPGDEVEYLPLFVGRVRKSNLRWGGALA